MSQSFDPARSSPTDGLFRPAEYILVVPQGSAIAILDLERGVMYATTPLGAEAWSTLVGDGRPPHRMVAESPTGSDDDEDHHVWSRIAGYLLDGRIIEPVAR